MDNIIATEPYNLKNDYFNNTNVVEGSVSWLGSGKENQYSSYLSNTDQLMLSDQAKVVWKASEIVKVTPDFSEEFVKAVKDRLENYPFPTEEVAQIMADKIVNGW